MLPTVITCAAGIKWGICPTPYNCPEPTQIGLGEGLPVATSAKPLSKNAAEVPRGQSIGDGKGKGNKHGVWVH